MNDTILQATNQLSPELQSRIASQALGLLDQNLDPDKLSDLSHRMPPYDFLTLIHTSNSIRKERGLLRIYPLVYYKIKTNNTPLSQRNLLSVTDVLKYRKAAINVGLNIDGKTFFYPENISIRYWVQCFCLKNITHLKIKNTTPEALQSILALVKLNPNITTLEIDGCEGQIQSLDFSQCQQLERIRIKNCNIRSLNASNLKELEELEVQ